MNNNFIAVLSLNNFGGIGIVEICNDFVTSAFDFGNGIKNQRTTKLYYNSTQDRYFFRRNNVKYYIDEFMRV